MLQQSYPKNVFVRQMFIISKISHVFLICVPLSNLKPDFGHPFLFLHQFQPLSRPNSNIGPAKVIPSVDQNGLKFGFLLISRHSD